MAKVFRLRTLISGLAALVPHSKNKGEMAVLFPRIENDPACHVPGMAVLTKCLRDKGGMKGEIKQILNGEEISIFHMKDWQITIGSIDKAGRLSEVRLGKILKKPPTDLIEAKPSSKDLAMRAFIQYDFSSSVDPVRQEWFGGILRGGSFKFLKSGKEEAETKDNKLKALAGGVEVVSTFLESSPVLRLRKIGCGESIEMVLEPSDNSGVVEMWLGNPACRGNWPKDSDGHFTAYYKLLGVNLKAIPTREGWTSVGIESYLTDHRFARVHALERKTRARRERIEIRDVPTHFKFCEPCSGELAGPPLCTKAVFEPIVFEMDPHP